MIENDKPVLIAGGGIGGLATALALGQKGVQVEVLEQANEFSEVGAGIQLGPNAGHILSKWKLTKNIEQRGFQPESIEIKNGRNNRLLNRIPLIPYAEELYGHPYHTIHRADLHDILYEAIKHYPNITLTNGFCVETIESDHTEPIISLNGETKTGCALIGADGIWSTVRNLMFNDQHPRYSGKTAWRALVPIENIPDTFKREVILYLGPHSHLVHYPVKQGAQLNIVAVITDPEEPFRQWDKAGETQQLLTHFQSWSPDIQEFLRSVKHWTKWALYGLPRLKNWSKGCMTLLGDAAHPTLPFMAQGAVMALEDADSLAQNMLEGKGVEEGFLNYQNDRIQRTSKVQATSKSQGRIYHMTSLLAFARNQVISKRSGLSLLKDYSWLYGYKP